MSTNETPDAKLAFAALLAGLHDDTLIGPRELAALTASTCQTTQKLARRSPERLPPRAAVPGRQLRWHLGTVRAWIRAHRTTAPDNPVRRVGAPRR